MPAKKKQSKEKTKTPTNDTNTLAGEKGGSSGYDQDLDLYHDEEIAFIPDVDDILTEEGELAEIDDIVIVTTEEDAL